MRIYSNLVIMVTYIFCLLYRLGQAYVTLYWSLFGLVALKDVKIQKSQYITEVMGMLLLMAYHGMATIVLINMLIAMMSNSYQNIEVMLTFFLMETL